MILPDVNVLVYAYRRDASEHMRFNKWLADLVNGEEAYASSDFVLSSFLRIVTHPSIFKVPTLLEDALDFTGRVRSQPNCVVLAPGPRHWEIFSSLCQKSRARGNLVTDAYLAALSIESGSEWITMDGDFARFPGLRWRRPFD